jgi:hypothetical protein
MARILVSALPIMLALVACAHGTHDSPAASGAPPAVVEAPAPTGTKPAPAVELRPAPQSSATAETPVTGANPSQADVANATPVASGPRASRSQPASAAAKPLPSGQAAPSPRPAPTSPVPSTPTAAPAASPATPALVATAPPLDLNGLEQRLRDTRAIGLFTKLSLKNQVDDLLAQFKAFHQGQSRIVLGQLRQEYELLLMKVVSLLQDGDPALASAVSSSREAIWGVLTDPRKFAAI